MLLLALLACAPPWHDVGAFRVRADRGGLDVEHVATGSRVDGLAWLAGAGTAAVTMSFGAFRFDDVTETIDPVDVRWDGDALVAPGLTLSLAADGDDALELAVALDDPPPPGEGRLGFAADCVDDEAILGLGSHAFDVDHAGEAFALWVSEPGVGKVDAEDPPDDWFLRGTRHASSYPVPSVVRPALRQGLGLRAWGRVDVDLCVGDRLSMVAWDDAVTLRIVAEARALDVPAALAVDRPALPPPWAFAPWNDAIRGEAEVRRVASALRAAGAPSSVIWTEDWKGASQTSAGYRLSEEWSLDRSLYPGAEALDADLEAAGFKWLAYFAPFVGVDSESGREAAEAGVLIGGEPFAGVTLAPTSMVDLTGDDGVAWAVERMAAARDVGFDGWMTDYAEWLPVDALLANGASGWEEHDRWPRRWQDANAAALDGDAVNFCRSGWWDTAGSCPVVWVGDQRTSFDADDGFPTVIPLVLGLSASGVPIATHDVAGYNSIGNPPSDRELWFRWAWLGAFSPVLRTHHGNFDDENHRWDSDPETVAHWVRVAREHTRLFPYLYGLAAEAAAAGTPMVRPIGLVFEGEDVARTDAWMLGDALLVAPVTERGATSRRVELPGAVGWFDWFTGEPAASGDASAPIDAIPVFAAAGTVVPTFDTVPDTLLPHADGLLGLDDVDGERVVRVFGGGGRFVEADGTTYVVDGEPTAGEVVDTLASGVIDLGGGTLAVDGPKERRYRVVVAQ